MRARTRLGVAPALAWVLMAGCQCGHGDDPVQAAIEGRSPHGTSPRAQDDRIAAITGAAIGVEPGYVAGAFVYASADARLLAELGPVLGTTGASGTGPALVELVELVAAVIEPAAPEARVSLSIRRIGPDTGLREALETSGGEQRELAGQVGVHARVHVAVADPQAIAGALARVSPASIGDPPTPSPCATIEAPARCLAGEGRLVILRPSSERDGYLADLFVTGAAPHPATIEAALALAGGVGRAELDGLTGDAALLIDGPELISAVRAELLATMIDSTRRDDSCDLERLRNVEGLLAELHQTERVFEGMTLELRRGPQGFTVRGRWLLGEGGRTRLREVFALDPVDADVPSLARLCDGALACVRTRGLLAPHRFASLATGIYADPDAVLAATNEPEAVGVLALETWPNAIAAATRIPAQFTSAPESMIAQTFTEVGGRVLGFGLSYRDLGAGPQAIGYARTSAGDLDAIARLLRVGGTSFTTHTVAGVGGRVESTPIVQRDAPDRYFAVYDGDAWGWAVAADDVDAVAWLAELDHDDGAVPLVYVEIPDVGRLLAANPGLRLEAPALAELLRERGVRAQLSLDSGGAPELRLAVGAPR